MTEECWEQHITKHHPEMAPYRDCVVETIETPDAIYEGKRDPLSRIYCRKYRRIERIGNSLDLLVFVGREDRYLRTTYFAAKAFRMLGEEIWHSR